MKEVFQVKGAQFFSVKDSWDNYNKLRPLIDTAYEKWRKQNRNVSLDASHVFGATTSTC